MQAVKDNSFLCFVCKQSLGVTLAGWGSRVGVPQRTRLCSSWAQRSRTRARTPATSPPFPTGTLSGTSHSAFGVRDFSLFSVFLHAHTSLIPSELLWWCLDHNHLHWKHPHLGKTFSLATWLQKPLYERNLRFSRKNMQSRCYGFPFMSYIPSKSNKESLAQNDKTRCKISLCRN